MHFIECTAPIDAKQGYVVFFLMSLSLAIVLLIHLLRPSWIIRAGRMRPFNEIADPTLFRPIELVIAELVAEAGLSKAPTFLVRPRAETGAFAFGHWFCSYICLDAGLMATFSSLPSSFRAKVRHELAHFRNRDINKTGLTTSAWSVFIVVVPFLLAFTVSVTPDYASTASILWRAAAIVAFVYFSRNAILRSREFYADARAYSWDTPKGALAHILEVSAQKSRPRSALSALVTSHPTPQARVRALAEPERLFQTNALDAAMVGVAVGIGVEALSINTGLISRRASIEIMTVIFLLFSSFLAGMTGLAIWRDTYAAVALRTRGLNVVTLAVASAIGLALGFRLSLVDMVMSTPQLQHNFPGVIAAAVLLAAFFAWVRSVAHAWTGTCLHNPRLVAASWVSIVAGACLLGYGWAALNLLHLERMMGTDLPDQFFAIDFPIWYAYKSSTFILIAVTWLLPGTAMLHPNVAVATNPVRSLVRFALAFALAYLVVLTCMRLYVRSTTPPDVWARPEVKIAAYWIWIKVSVALQALMAFLFCLCHTKPSFILGCLCAFFTSILLSLILLAVNIAFGGSIDFQFLRDTVILNANLGAVFAALSAGVAVGLRFAMRFSARETIASLKIGAQRCRDALRGQRWL